MALDHVRDFFHIEAFTGNPLDAQTTTPALYFTRWITHFCAPVFIFLSGTSAYLAGIKKSVHERSSFLFKRGLWLIIAEVTLVNFGWQFDIHFKLLFLQVIWAIGISMVALSLLARLPRKAVLGTGIAITLLHNLLDYLPSVVHESLWFNLLHTSGFKVFPLTSANNIITVYGFLPWLGIMCVGYGVGHLFEKTMEPAIRKKHLLNIGSGLIISFVILRLLNGYGNPTPYQSTTNVLATFYRFMDVSKYPPSLMYSCITLGPALLLLVWFEQLSSRLTNALKTIGAVPFFYYVLHIYVIHILVIPLFFLQGYQSTEIMQEPFWFRPEKFGLELPWVYAIWVAVVIALYPACKWYKQYKSTHQYWWLSYL